MSIPEHKNMVSGSHLIDLLQLNGVDFSSCCGPYFDLLFRLGSENSFFNEVLVRVDLWSRLD